MTTETAPPAGSTAPGYLSCDRAAGTTRSLLGWGVLAGPLYVFVWLVQALLRDGFDLTRHSASLLSNGPSGWVQTVNFLLAGAMTFAAAAGVRRALGSRLVGGLLGGYGAGLVGAGLFRADPVDGFPAGTPVDGAVSTTGLLHMVSGGVGFVCLVAACLVVAHRSARAGAHRWVAFSTATAVLYVTASVGISSGDPTGPVVLGFTAAMVLGWAWLAALCARLYMATEAHGQQFASAASPGGGS